MNNQKYSPEYLLKQTAGARASLLAVLIFTVVNLAMLLLEILGKTILDLVFHGLIIFQLIQGISANYKLEKMIAEFDPSDPDHISF